mgnify:CR=1 FL=1
MYMPCRASCKISWKHLFLGFFLVICQTGWRILLFLDCFFTFIWPLKVIKTLFTYFNHQIKSITSLNCKMTLIQFVFLRGDSALCYSITWYSIIYTQVERLFLTNWYSFFNRKKGLPFSQQHNKYWVHLILFFQSFRNTV